MSFGLRQAHHHCGGGLGHGFKYQHSRQYGLFGKMSVETEFVGGHAFNADAALVLLYYLHPVHQQERVAVRDYLQHFYARMIRMGVYSKGLISLIINSKLIAN